MLRYSIRKANSRPQTLRRAFSRAELVHGLKHEIVKKPTVAFEPGEEIAAWAQRLFYGPLQMT